MGLIVSGEYSGSSLEFNTPAGRADHIARDIARDQSPISILDSNALQAAGKSHLDLVATAHTPSLFWQQGSLLGRSVLAQQGLRCSAQKGTQVSMVVETTNLTRENAAKHIRSPQPSGAI